MAAEESRLARHLRRLQARVRRPTGDEAGRVLDAFAKAFDLLTVLIERRPAIVKRAELQDRYGPRRP